MKRLTEERIGELVTLLCFAAQPPLIDQREQLREGLGNHLVEVAGRRGRLNIGTPVALFAWGSTGAGDFIEDIVGETDEGLKFANGLVKSRLSGEEDVRVRYNGRRRVGVSCPFVLPEGALVRRHRRIDFSP